MDLGLWSRNQDRRVGTTGLVGAVRRYEQWWRRVHIPAVSLQFIDGFGSGGWPAGGDVHGREACPTFVHPCTSTRESLFFALGFGVMCV